MLPTSITCPSPPRCLPAPPESLRYSLRRNIDRGHRLGHLDRDVRTPDGKAVTSSPSLRGRAPVPPQWKITVLNGGTSHLRRAPLDRQVGPPIDVQVPQPRGALGWHAAGHGLMQAAEHEVGQHVADRVPGGDGAGRLTFSTQPSGALAVIGASEPALFGTLGATMHLTPNAYRPPYSSSRH